MGVDVVLSIDVGIKNLAYCVLRRSDLTVLFWSVFAIEGGDRDVCVNLLRTVSALHEAPPPPATSPDEEAAAPAFAWADVDQVVIEQQPGRNMRVKAVENYLHMYYVMRGQRVIVYSARRKLQGSGMEHRGRSAAQYRARKKASVALCRDWLSRHPQNDRWKDMVHGRGVKADDAADALNQALSYLGAGCEAAAPAAADEAEAQQARVREQVTVRARKPTARQLTGGGRYTASNLKHFFCKVWPREELKARIASDKKAMAAVRRLYAPPAAEAGAGTTGGRTRTRPRPTAASDARAVDAAIAHLCPPLPSTASDIA
jgi:hypothetical protein